VLSATRRGNVKKTALADLPGATAKTFLLMKINQGDAFGWVRLTDGSQDVLLATADGKAICFSEEEVRPMGLGAAGVGGVKLAGSDEVIGLELARPKAELLLVASDGKAKRVEIGQFPQQGRYGQGVVAWKLAAGVRLVGAVAAPAGSKTSLTLHLAQAGSKEVRFNQAALQTRVASGKALVPVKGSERVTALTAPADLGAPAAAAQVPASNGKQAATAVKGSPAAPKKGAAEKPAAKKAAAKTTAAAEKPAPKKAAAKTSPAVEKAAPKKAAAKTTAAAEKPAPKKAAAKTAPAAEKPAPKKTAKKAPAEVEAPPAASKKTSKAAQPVQGVLPLPVEETPKPRAKKPPKP
jgi:hypothetical protein